MPSDEPLKKAYQFLLRHAKTGKMFTKDDLASATGWQGKTPATYLSKQLRSIVDRDGDLFKVKRHFVHLRLDDFLKRTSQKESILPSYKRTSHDSVLNYEFLMPLTREDLLRQNLDRLFFRDMLEEQIKLVGLDHFTDEIARKDAESDDSYSARIALVVASYFGGYSITHVNGRFRADRLLTQQQAIGNRYIIDETTAIVRFIIPLTRTVAGHGEIFNPKYQRRDSSDAVAAEVALIRRLFFTIFAEVVVHSVQGEDQIWLLENLDGNTRLYKWEVRATD